MRNEGGVRARGKLLKMFWRRGAGFADCRGILQVQYASQHIFL